MGMTDDKRISEIRARLAGRSHVSSLLFDDYDPDTDISHLLAEHDRLTAEIRHRNAEIDGFSNIIKERGGAIEKLTERCEAYKGRVDAGAVEIQRWKEICDRLAEEITILRNELEAT